MEECHNQTGSNGAGQFGSKDDECRGPEEISDTRWLILMIMMIYGIICVILIWGQGGDYCLIHIGNFILLKA